EVDERMSDASEVTNHPAVLVIPEPIAEREAGDLAPEFELAHQPPADIAPLRSRIVEILTVNLLRLGEPEHVHDPGPDRLDHHLRAFAFQKTEHAEVAVTLGGLRPELACHFHDRFHAQPVYVNRPDAFPRRRECL